MPAQDNSHSSSFSIDWERLNDRDIENLCRELLSQMGFERLEWEERMSGIDLVAELPKKDPDGFEYVELWVISMALDPTIPLDIMLSLNLRTISNSERFGKYFVKGMETPITFLLIFFDANPAAYVQANNIQEHFESLGYKFRLRIWDRTYLTSLVRQYPQIGYKYFSAQGRISSKTRKSYEELFKENLTLLTRQSELIAKLEEEKNMRIRAERDAIWKDISFSAAHKIGNPIFAIETDLDPLARRIREQRTKEAEEVIENIRSSLEKAKALVEQFKSLARAQEIRPVATPLRPILEDAVRPLCHIDTKCMIECPSTLTVMADPERLSECFAELIENAKHWLDKDEKKIELKAIYPAGLLPKFLDSTKSYALVHVTDNGCGIPAPNKQKIFDAFFTTFDHGSGLGLALVRRIIEGHGGAIIETGIPGQGADFEIYLPVPGEDTHKIKRVKTRRKKE
ncbi:MAG: sensor histidine kinase [Candidatus Omnitrophota bacterium]